MRPNLAVISATLSIKSDILAWGTPQAPSRPARARFGQSNANYQIQKTSALGLMVSQQQKNIPTLGSCAHLNTVHCHCGLRTAISRSLFWRQTAVSSKSGAFWSLQMVCERCKANHSAMANRWEPTTPFWLDSSRFTNRRTPLCLVFDMHRFCTPGPIAWGGPQAPL